LTLCQQSDVIAVTIVSEHGTHISPKSILVPPPEIEPGIAEVKCYRHALDHCTTATLILAMFFL
jgi:hypothetical protein